MVASDPWPVDALEFKGHRYKFYEEQVTWKQAKQKCENMSGQLVVIESAEENMRVARARYANGIAGSEAFMADDMKTAPEVVVPAELKAAAYVAKTCPPEATKLYTAIWTELQK